MHYAQLQILKHVVYIFTNNILNFYFRRNQKSLQIIKVESIDSHKSTYVNLGNFHLNHSKNCLMVILMILIWLRSQNSGLLMK